MYIYPCCCDFNFLIPYQRKKNCKLFSMLSVQCEKMEKQKMISSKRTCLQFLILIESPLREPTGVCLSKP